MGQRSFRTCEQVNLSGLGGSFGTTFPTPSFLQLREGKSQAITASHGIKREAPAIHTDRQVDRSQFVAPPIQASSHNCWLREPFDPAIKRSPKRGPAYADLAQDPLQGDKLIAGHRLSLSHIREHDPLPSTAGKARTSHKRVPYQTLMHGRHDTKTAPHSRFTPLVG